MGIARKFSRFWRLDAKDKWLLVRAAVWLAVARTMLLFMSFQRLSARLAENQLALEQQPDPELLRRVSFAVAAAANHVPWRSDCFPQCIAARTILGKEGFSSVIHLGVERVGETDLEGHAWLTCGDTVVAGDGEDLERFTEVHRYPG